MSLATTVLHGRTLLSALVLITTHSVGFAEVETAQKSVPPVADFPQSETRIIQGGSFELSNHLGEAITDADFRSKYLLIFFGYTHCPDICPTDLSVMAQALKLLGEEGKNIQPVFITFDPARDTVERLADYVQNFHPRLIGLTGSKEQTLAVANRYGVDVAATYKAELPGSAYSMNHSAFTYFVDQEGNLKLMFRHGTSSSLMADSIRKYVSK